MSVEIVEPIEVAWENQSGRHVVGAGKSGHQHQAFARDLDEAADGPGGVPETEQVEQDEGGKQRGQPADAPAGTGLKPLLDAARGTAKHLGNRQAEQQPEQGEHEFEVVHRGATMRGAARFCQSAALLGGSARAACPAEPRGKLADARLIAAIVVANEPDQVQEGSEEQEVAEGRIDQIESALHDAPSDIGAAALDIPVRTGDE